MADDNTIKRIEEQLSEFEIESADEERSEKELIAAIRIRVAQLLERDPGLLFSYLYRLDVSERKVGEAIKGLLDPSPVNAIADLIYRRQLIRVETKKSIKQKPIDGWEW